MSARTRVFGLAFAVLWCTAVALAQQDAAQLIEVTKGAIRRGKALETRYPEIIQLGSEAVSAIERALLSENDEGLRIAGAMMLARIAEKTQAANTIKPLERCWSDSSAAVNYWGAWGLLALKGLPSERADALLTGCLSLRRPYPIRIVACAAARRRKAAKAVPFLAAIISKRAPEYTKAKKDLFVYKEKTEKAGARGGPGEAGAGGQPGEEGATAEPTIRIRPIIPSQAPARVVEGAANALEEHEAVLETRHAGMALEEIVKQDFGFRREPSWNLATSIMKAKEWYEANKAKYPGGPEEADKEKPEETAKPEAAPKAPVAPVGPGLLPGVRGGALK